MTRSRPILAAGDPSTLPRGSMRAMRFFSAGSGEARLGERLAILSAGDGFATIPPSGLRLLAAMFGPGAYPAGSVIRRLGERAAHVYAVAAGAADVPSDGGVGPAVSRLLGRNATLSTLAPPKG